MKKGTRVGAFLTTVDESGFTAFEGFRGSLKLETINGDR